jgi:hypothetical protein
VAIGEDLGQAASVAAAYGEVCAVLAAQLGSGERTYLLAVGEGEQRRWLVLDQARALVDEREVVKEVAGIVALCEIAVELAAGDLPPKPLVAPTEEVPAVAAAAAALREVVGEPPWIASPDFLDAVGVAARRLEQARGDFSSPFASALAAHTATVEAFVGDVEFHHAVSLR